MKTKIIQRNKAARKFIFIFFNENFWSNCPNA